MNTAPEAGQTSSPKKGSCWGSTDRSRRKAYLESWSRTWVTPVFWEEEWMEYGRNTFCWHSDSIWTNSTTGSRKEGWESTCWSRNPYRKQPEIRIWKSNLKGSVSYTLFQLVSPKQTKTAIPSKRWYDGKCEEAASSGLFQPFWDSPFCYAYKMHPGPVLIPNTAPQSTAVSSPSVPPRRQRWSRKTEPPDPEGDPIPDN